MNDEARFAFEMPLARAHALAGPEARDRIAVRDYLREVEIGAFQSERGVRQKLKFNIVLEVAPHQAGLSDDVDQVLSYDTIVQAIETVLADERVNLLETLGERVADLCLADARAERVFIRIEKLDRIPGTLGIDIVRTRRQREAGDRPLAKLDMPHPVVVFLSNEVMNTSSLANWLDAIEALPTASVICVEAAQLPAPQAGHVMAQRRIDLLAIEQNAWVLAGRDARCVVVDNRTELDWAMREGRMSVWAPSKIVLDAAQKPSLEAGPAALACWFASQFEACAIIFAGGARPDLTADLPLHHLPADDAAGLKELLAS